MSIVSNILLDIGRISNYNTMDTYIFETTVYIALGGSRGILLI